MKKIYIFASLLFVVALMVGSFSCSKPVSPTSTAEPIKIGVCLPFSGTLSEQSSNVLNGFKLAFNEVNWEIGGRKIEVVTEDDGADIAIGTAKYRKLMLVDKVDMIIGPYVTAKQDINSEPLFEQRPIVRLFPYAINILEDEKWDKCRFRVSYNSPAFHACSAWVAYKELGYRKGVLFAPDFVDGYINAEDFKKVFEQLGGKITQEFYIPMGCIDFAPYLIKLDLNNTDFVWSFQLGGDAVRFVKQYADYGLKERLGAKSMYLFTPFEDAYLEAIGEAAVGGLMCSTYTRGLGTPECNRFNKLVSDTYGKESNDQWENGYVVGRLAIIAIQAVNGNMTDVDGQVAAIENASFEAPRGPYKMDAKTHFPTQNMYLMQVVEVDGKVQNKVLKTYPDIYPYWLPPELR